MSRNLLARLFEKNQLRAANSNYRKRQKNRLRFERLEERAMMTFAAATLGTPVPAFNSLVGAPATLYLDFDGNRETIWGTHEFDGTWSTPFTEMKDKRPGIITPAFDADGNPIGFSAADNDAIRQIWQRVAEDFAPFNINVTTVDPGSFKDKQALRVAIGGSASDWFQDSTAPEFNSGISSANSFTDSESNVVYVFSDLIRYWDTTKSKDGDGRPIQFIPAVANTISHEAGHAFGLRHQSTFHASGTVKQDYNPGGADWTPIMGDNLGSDRTKWWNGMADNKMTQDQMEVLAGPANGFGYRPQEAVRTLVVQSPYSSPNSSPSTLGVISKITEGDGYWFSTSGGPTQISVVVAAESGPNLDATLTIWQSTPWIPYFPMTFVGYVDAAPTSTDQGLHASYYNASLSGGMYHVKVGSHGTYGDVGRYTIRVTAGQYQIPSIPPPPSGAYYLNVPTGGFSVPTGGFVRYSGGASAGLATTVLDDATSSLQRTASPAAAPVTRAVNGLSQDRSSRRGGQHGNNSMHAVLADAAAFTLLPANTGKSAGNCNAGGQLSPQDAVFSRAPDFLLDDLLADLL